MSGKWRGNMDWIQRTEGNKSSVVVDIPNKVRKGLYFLLAQCEAASDLHRPELIQCGIRGHHSGLKSQPSVAGVVGTGNLWQIMNCIKGMVWLDAMMSGITCTSITILIWWVNFLIKNPSRNAPQKFCTCVCNLTLGYRKASGICQNWARSTNDQEVETVTRTNYVIQKGGYYLDVHTCIWNAGVGKQLTNSRTATELTTSWMALGAAHILKSIHLATKWAK